MPTVNAPHIPRVIYVQTIFDTETILKNYAKSTDPTQPTGLPHPDPSGRTVMYMLTNWANTLSGQATGNLEIQAEVNDIINWRTMSLSNNTGDAVMFYAFGGTDEGIISKPALEESHPTVPVPILPFTPPYNYKMETITDVYWYSLVRSPGSTTYTVSFFILTQDPSTGALVRYFYWWDPKVTVKQT